MSKKEIKKEPLSVSAPLDNEHVAELATTKPTVAEMALRTLDMIDELWTAGYALSSFERDKVFYVTATKPTGGRFVGDGPTLMAAIDKLRSKL
jgi:hypothetical protein